MTVVSLPLTFQNSFWSQDYRKGLEVLFSQLEQGIAENEDIVTFIRSRAAAEAALGAALTTPPAGTAFDVEDGASLRMAFLGLKEETVAQGKIHDSIAKDLQTKVAGPFDEWAEGYKERLRGSKASIVNGYLRAYEGAQGDVAHLKDQYLAKTRKADEAEDDARFAPVSQPVGDKYTSSPVLGPRDKRPQQPRAPTRQLTVSERITARLKEFRLNTANTAPHEVKPEVQFDADAEEKTTEPVAPKVDKGKGRAVEPETSPIIASPPPLSPPLPPARLNTDVQPTTTGPPIVVAGVSFTPGQLSALLTKAKETLPLRPVRFPVLGEYQDAFTGEEFSNWLRDHVKQYNDDLDRAEDAARELTEKLNLLRRLGELGNEFEDLDDAWYQFRAKAFNLDGSKGKDVESAISPLQKNLAPIADGVAKRTGTFANLVSKALTSNATNEPPYVRARREADAADQEYRTAIRKLDRQRLGLEERIEDTLKTLQKWELDRLRAVRTVLSQYHACLEGSPQVIGSSLERSSTLIASYQPEADLRALIEQYRTGPFRPTAHVYESVAHDEADVVFGIDLRKWADLGVWSPAGGSPENKDVIPPVLVALFTALKEAYAKLPSDAEKRKTWIYEVPLPAVHHLRETLNSVPPEQDIPDDVLSKYDPPVLASAIKLWALELDPPLCMYEGWDEFRKLYPTVGAVKAPEGQPSEEQHIQDLQAALQRLPRIHLFVLDAVVKHLKQLIDSTAEGDEPNDVYIAKLALSLGRSIVRPKVENEFSIQDRHPTLLFIDLLKKYDQILPPTIVKKKRESERKVPVRRRTRPVDMRMSRSRISAGADLKELAAAQMAHRGLRSPPPVPPLPAIPNVPETNIIPPTPAVAETPMVGAMTAEPETLHEEPEDIAIHDQGNPEATPAPEPEPVSVSAPAVPPPPPITNAVPPPPALPISVPPPPPLPQSTEIPPTFKEPPPEVDEDLPPRPTFKEPPPETEETHELPMPNFPEPRSASPPLPMPSFVDPPEEPLTPPAGQSSPSPFTSTSPKSRSPPPRKPPSRAGSISSRSTSPSKADAQAQAAAAARVRGPRTTGGPRAPGGGVAGGSVGNMARFTGN
ncbi:unnamed protein product [Somion occarium]|uniref:Rho-GTPase-activating protein 8 n=1 Tax=Somion occarium TaxID=3059160 RepID=A0ABP1E3S1_9APHY